MTPEDRQARAGRLKERIYITFTALAVVLTLTGRTDISARTAATTLLVTVAGSALAMFLAEVLAHIVVHDRVLTRAEAGHAAATVAGALSAVVLPILLLASAMAGRWSVTVALRASVVVLVLWLVGVGYAAVRGLSLPLWQRMLMLLVEAGAGIGVVALELLAHH